MGLSTMSGGAIVSEGPAEPAPFKGAHWCREQRCDLEITLTVHFWGGNLVIMLIRPTVSADDKSPL